PGRTTMHANARRIADFYSAFQRRDAAAMGACYHDAARFSDPVFTDLDAAGARAMWAMLLAGGKDLRIEFGQVQADDTSGSAHWDAWYTFSATGRPVLNRIDASFEFRDGLIVRHQDRFDFHRWAAQALGLPGRLLGGTGFLRRKVQGQAAARLAQWQQRSG
ncbi:MAG: nuclear transport factor 2 family protein, partial [Solimonas sp.]